MAKIVKYAKVHQDIFAPGVGTFGNTLPPSNKHIPGLKMSLEEEGLLLSTPQGDILVPHANVVLMVLAEPYHASIPKLDLKSKKE